MRVLTVEPPVITERTTPTTYPPAPLRISEYPRASRLIVHFSDTHLLAGDARLWDTLDSDSRLAAALLDLESSGARPDAIIFTGDLADLGEPDAYDKIRTMVEPVAARLGAKIIWLMGNHDHRPTFRSHMLGHLPAEDPVDAVYDLGGLRIIALDSSVPGAHHGALTEHQLMWLTDVLATPAPRGTILALHHPPIPSVIDMAMTVELYDQEKLAEVLRGTDVRTILAGHLHYSSSAMFAGIPVSVASATCYTQDLSVVVGGARPRDGAQAFNLVHVYEDTIVHSVVPIGSGPELTFISPDEASLSLAAAGITVRVGSHAR